MNLSNIPKSFPYFRFLRNLLLIVIIYGCASQKIKKDILVYSSPEIKPLWVDRLTLDNSYKGMVTNRQSEEEAINGAFEDAVSEVIEEIGIRVQSEFEEKKTEEGDVINVSVRTRTKTRAQGIIEGTKIVGTYIEKFRKHGEKENYYFNGYALVEIPKGEIERARIRINEYNQKILKDAEDLWGEAEKKEEGYPYSALCDFKSIREILIDVGLPEAKALLVRAENKITYLEEMKDPMMKLETLSGNKEIIEKFTLINPHGTMLKDAILDIGDRIRTELKLKDSVYIYVINYDKKTNEARLLFPNKIETDNYISGEMIYPEKSEFKAVPPGGTNTIFLIVSKSEINIPNFGRQIYISLNNPLLWNFIKELRVQVFDIKRIDFYIRE